MPIETLVDKMIKTSAGKKFPVKATNRLLTNLAPNTKATQLVNRNKSRIINNKTVLSAKLKAPSIGLELSMLAAPFQTSPAKTL